MTEPEAAPGPQSAARSAATGRPSPRAAGDAGGLQRQLAALFRAFLDEEPELEIRFDARDGRLLSALACGRGSGTRRLELWWRPGHAGRRSARRLLATLLAQRPGPLRSSRPLATEDPASALFAAAGFVPQLALRRFELSPLWLAGLPLRRPESLRRYSRCDARAVRSFVERHLGGWPGGLGAGPHPRSAVALDPAGEVRGVALCRVAGELACVEAWIGTDAAAAHDVLAMVGREAGPVGVRVARFAFDPGRLARMPRRALRVARELPPACWYRYPAPD